MINRPLNVDNRMIRLQNDNEITIMRYISCVPAQNNTQCQHHIVYYRQNLKQADKLIKRMF